MGNVLGLVGGALAGWLAGGLTGAVIGVFVGLSNGADLVRAVWLVVRRRDERNVLTLPDALGLLLVVAGTLAGGAVGYWLGDDGDERARYLFAGMIVAGLVCNLVSTWFSMNPFRGRMLTWFGPLVTGLCGWGLHSLWHSPFALVIAFLVGASLAGFIAERLGVPEAAGWTKL